ncbi:MAG TPA: peptidoglycan-binding protein [Pseudonocardiaceae bacterium]|nr:peptidoglycan-binding protein [Pseudonocardiaceae bacterium]
MTDEALPRHARPRRRVVTTAIAVVLLAGAGAAVVERNRILPASGSPNDSGVTDNNSPTTLATVARQDLTSQQQVNGTLGYTGNYGVLNHAQGTITWLPSVGQVISRGQMLYRVNGNPVVLRYGAVPLYRDLSEGDTGQDVLELNADLAALGYRVNSASDTYDWRTKAAVWQQQKAMGVTEDGVLHQAEFVVLPGAIRVTSVPAALGGPAGGAVLQASSTIRQVTVALDATQQGNVKVGDSVTITLPNNQTTPGTVSTMGTVATAPSGQNGGSPTVEVDITPTDPTATGTLDQAPVRVSITTASAPGALVVPVNALLALTGGGYAVELVEPGGAHKLVGVTLGLFDDASGLVQVTGTALRPGDRVVAAGS